MTHSAASRAIRVADAFDDGPGRRPEAHGYRVDDARGVQAVEKANAETRSNRALRLTDDGESRWLKGELARSAGTSMVSLWLTTHRSDER